MQVLKTTPSVVAALRSSTSQYPCKRSIEPLAHLPTSDSWNDQDEGERDHREGDQKTHLQHIFRYGRLVIPIECGKRLRTKGISHCDALPLQTTAGRTIVNCFRLGSSAALVFSRAPSQIWSQPDVY